MGEPMQLANHLYGGHGGETMFNVESPAADEDDLAFAPYPRIRQERYNSHVTEGGHHGPASQPCGYMGGEHWR